MLVGAGAAAYGAALSLQGFRPRDLRGALRSDPFREAERGRSPGPGYTSALNEQAVP